MSTQSYGFARRRAVLRAVLPGLMLAGAVAACSTQQIDTAQTTANADVAQAQPTVAMACWLAQAADAGFQAYAAVQKLDSGVIADEQKAMAATVPICANPPANVAEAVADVMAAYKSVVAVTPAPAAPAS
jgi:hypothetical protein